MLESEWARNYYYWTYTRTQATNMFSVIAWVFLDSLAYHLSSMSWKTPQSPILIKLDTLVTPGPERNYNKQIIPLRFRISIFHWRLRDLWNEFDSYFSDCIIVIALLKSNVNVLIYWMDLFITNPTGVHYNEGACALLKSLYSQSFLGLCN